MNEVDEYDKFGSNSHSFHVTTHRQRLEDFNQVITREVDRGSSHSIPVPLTFPAAWFGLSEVKSSIVASIGNGQNPSQMVLLHLEQTIEMLGQLDVDKTYTLEIQVGELKEDGRLPVSAQIVDSRLETIANLTSLFAVVDPKEKR